MAAIFEYHTRDHERLADLLARATASRPFDLALYRQFRGGLLRHIGIEEKLLMPELKRLRGGEAHPLAKKLRRDHGAIASLLVPTPTPEIVALLHRILEPHNRIEDEAGGLYESADQLVGAAAAELLARIEAVHEPPQAAFNDTPPAFRQIADNLRAAGIDLPPPTAPAR